MKILVHDFVGHPFQVQLSRELAGRGHKVTHTYATGLPGPKGPLARSPSDSCNLTIRELPLSPCFRKYSPIRRLISQRRYAADLRNLIAREEPHVVLSGNTPIDVQAQLLQHCQGAGIAFVHWVQDVYFCALEFFLRRRLGPLARLPVVPFRLLEKRVARRSNSVIVIAPEFQGLLNPWRPIDSAVTVIENWAPLDDLTSCPRRNAWSAEHGLADEATFVYSGTLGFKHRPDLIYQLAQSTLGRARIVVLTDGFGRQYLERMPALKNLLVLGFQPYDRLPEVLASADVLVATLSADAGQFAVPSKVLTYLAAGRPVLLASPENNAAASAVRRSGGGIVVDPDDPARWIAAARELAGSDEMRQKLGRRGRQYAEDAFRIDAIADRFEQVLLRACARHASVQSLERARYAAAR